MPIQLDTKPLAGLGGERVVSPSLPSLMKPLTARRLCPGRKCSRVTLWCEWARAACARGPTSSRAGRTANTAATRRASRLPNGNDVSHERNLLFSLGRTGRPPLLYYPPPRHGGAGCPRLLPARPPTTPRRRLGRRSQSGHRCGGRHVAPSSSSTGTARDGSGAPAVDLLHQYRHRLAAHAPHGVRDGRDRQAQPVVDAPVEHHQRQVLGDAQAQLGIRAAHPKRPVRIARAETLGR